MAEGANTVSPTGNVISSEARRRFSVPYASGRPTTFDLPRDTVLKRIDWRLEGYWSNTYASGSPIAHSQGVADRICPNLDIVIDGQRVVKSISPYMQQMLNHLYSGNRPRRAYTNTASAAVPTTLRAGTETVSGAAFVYPATTFYTLINEAWSMFFEQPWAYSFGAMATLLNIKNVSSAVARFNFVDISNIQRDESSPVSITYGDINLNFILQLIEAREVASEQNFFDFKETYKEIQVSAQATNLLIDLPRGNGISGIALLTQNGDANRSLNDRSIRSLQLQVNGANIVQRTEFVDLQESNQVRYGANDPMASSDHSLEGFAYMNLLKSGDIRSALNSSISSGVDQVQLSVDTASTTAPDAATYTNPIKIKVWTQEIAATPPKV